MERRIFWSYDLDVLGSRDVIGLALDSEYVDSYTFSTVTTHVSY